MARNVRVELRPGREGHDGDFKFLLTKFRRARSEAGIEAELRRREYYESPGQKRRRKKREAERADLKAKLRENFSSNRGR